MKLAGFLAVVLCGVTQAQTGHWEGAIRHQNGDKLFTVDLDQQPVWTGSFAIPGRDAPALSLSEIEINLPSVHFRIPDLPGSPTFKGVLGESGSSIKGVVTQENAVVAFEMRRTGGPHVQAVPSNSALSSNLLGDWTGSLHSQDPIQILLHLRLDDHGLGAGSLDTADRRARNLVLSAISQAGRKLSFEVRLIGGRFQGELSADDTRLAGSWTQNGSASPLEFAHRN